ncbi:ABC transporter ATP-binding protein [Lentibacillus saliphilus]|uniref:ABC transporter ATP-binding protein n=1 Tax=Lentibacillus saliphilus TaxID=2737028 RepID=UPI001C2F3AD2|nr:ABC transporter ATP-binding protein [Lentibacillus saliphilus]
MKIEVDQLTKVYRDKRALDNVSLTLSEPKIYGFLGRNGAGKTTFMEILTGQILATSGTLRVNGEAPFDNQKLTESICLIKEGGNFKKELTIKNVLKLYRVFYPNWDQALANELIEAYGLNVNARIKSLSKGMASALGIIVGLASMAPITMFDEPYIGLDASARKMFYDKMVAVYEKQKRIIIFSTHLIDEVSTLFEEVIIIQNGSIVLQEEADVLREKACAVSGPKADVTAYMTDKNVMQTKEIAGMMTAYVYGDAVMEAAHAAGLAVEGIPIQELMVYLTEEKRGA